VATYSEERTYVNYMLRSDVLTALIMKIPGDYSDVSEERTASISTVEEYSLRCEISNCQKNSKATGGS
jgi:hypothetical protein